MSRSMFVPRLMDESNLNAQNKNAQMLLRYWPDSGWRIATVAYNAPAAFVTARKDIEVIRLWRRHGWMPHLFLRYLRRYDVVFYPGVSAADAAGMRWRRRLGLSAPVISTLEGLAGNTEREREYSEWAGHAVFCQHVSPEVLRRVDTALEVADHVIAISPFLARMGKRRYGDKFSVLPLGIDNSIFYPSQSKQRGRPKVVSAGRLESHKRPELFLRLATSFPDADFVWYGEGALRASLSRDAEARGLRNIAFPGSKTPYQLAEAFRSADIFAMPSMSEGVPKVTQEAAACGLPVVLFGHYEAPSVLHDETGFVVWSDDELVSAIEVLLKEPERLMRMGRKAAELAKDWDWSKIAPMWEASIMNALLTTRSV